MTRMRRARALLAGSIALIALAMLLLVLASPLALPLLDRTGERDWGRLSDIGETYGAVSALLSTLALGGVIASLALQRQAARLDRRSAQLDREQMHRMIHLELIKLGLDSPELLDIFGRRGTAPTARERRQYVYINLWVSFWMTSYEIGHSTADELLRSASNLFASPIGRRWWGEIGVDWIRGSMTPRRQELHRLMHQAWQQAVEREGHETLVERAESPDTSRLGGLRSRLLGGPVRPRRPERNLLGVLRRVCRGLIRRHHRGS